MKDRILSSEHISNPKFIRTGLAMIAFGLVLGGCGGIEEQKPPFTYAHAGNTRIECKAEFHGTLGSFGLTTDILEAHVEEVDRVLEKGIDDDPKTDHVSGITFNRDDDSMSFEVFGKDYCTRHKTGKVLQAIQIEINH